MTQCPISLGVNVIAAFGSLLSIFRDLGTSYLNVLCSDEYQNLEGEMQTVERDRAGCCLAPALRTPHLSIYLKYHHQPIERISGFVE
jgi:hypothetical protein